MANVKDLLEPPVVTIIQNGPHTDWRTIVTNVVDWLTTQGKCFSSGEIAAMLRTVDERIAFRVNSIGELLREQFFAGTMPLYMDPNGGGRTVPVLYVPRLTTGTGRTPAGQEVFVYAPEQAMGEVHDFEVDIPTPPGMNAPALLALPAPSQTSGTQQIQPQLPRGKHHNAQNPVQITGNPAAATQAHAAVVQTDGRARIGRVAFDAFVHATGQPLVGGQPVYLSFQGDLVVVTVVQDPNVASVPYSLSTWNGEIRFVSPNGRFVPGMQFPIRVTKESLIVDLSPSQL